VLALALVAVSSSAAFHTTASTASAVSCGAAITTTTVLTTDIGPCPGPGIILAADHIVLNLAGHKVIGPFTHADFPGIVVPQRTGVTITGGTVSGFSAGLDLVGGSGNSVVNMTFSHNHGPRFNGNFGDGILIDGSANNRVVASTIGPDNGPYDGIGILDQGADNNVIEGNRIVGNGSQNDQEYGPGTVTFTPGIHIDSSNDITDPNPLDPVHGNQVIGNAITDNEETGMDVFFKATGTVIRGNDIERNGLLLLHEQGSDTNGNVSGGQGIHLNLANYTVVTQNTITNNCTRGILVDPNPPTGTAGLVGAFNTFSANNAVGNARTTTVVTTETNQRISCGSTANTGSGPFFDLDDIYCGDRTPTAPSGFTDVWKGNLWSTGIRLCNGAPQDLGGDQGNIYVGTAQPPPCCPLPQDIHGGPPPVQNTRPQSA
jgi:hypothetical protein